MPTEPVAKTQQVSQLLQLARTAAGSSRWLSAQSAAVRDALLEGSVLQRFSRRAPVLSIGEARSSLFFLVSGGIEVSVARPSLDVATVGFLPTGAWFGAHSALSGVPSSVEYRASSQSTALVIPQARVARLLREVPASAAALADLLALSVHAQYDAIASLTAGGGDGRVLGVLLSIAGAAEPDVRGGITLRMSHELLAAAAGASRSTVSKVLNDLERRSVIKLGYGTIVVRDLARLSAAVGASD